MSAGWSVGENSSLDGDCAEIRRSENGSGGGLEQYADLTIGRGSRENGNEERFERFSREEGKRSARLREVCIHHSA